MSAPLLTRRLLCLGFYFTFLMRRVTVERGDVTRLRPALLEMFIYVAGCLLITSCLDCARRHGLANILEVS